MQGDHPRLGASFTPRLGVKTGANSVFLEPPADVEAALIRRALRGRDIRAFRAVGGVRIFFPHGADGAPFDACPPGRPVMSRITKPCSAPAWTFSAVFPGACSGSAARWHRHRVVWADLARGLTATALTAPEGSSLIPLNSCYLVHASDRGSALALSAWLNSTWIRAVARAGADVAAGGFARFNARVVADVPLPGSVLGDRRLVRVAERASLGEATQEELDVICAEHLALPQAARDVLLRFTGVGSDNRG